MRPNWLRDLIMLQCDRAKLSTNPKTTFPDPWKVSFCMSLDLRQKDRKRERQLYNERGGLNDLLRSIHALRALLG